MARSREFGETRLAEGKSQKSITACFTCANHCKWHAGSALGGNVLETLFVMLEVVTLITGFGLLGVYIGARYY